MTKYQLWRFLSPEQKEELKKKYEIVPSGHKEVVNNKLVRDGVLEGDIEVIPYKLLGEMSGMESKIEDFKDRVAKEEEAVAHVSYKAMKKDDLVELAKDRELEYENLNKEDLIKLLNEYDEQDQDQAS